MAETAQRAVPAPDLGIPPSPRTVDMSIIDTTGSISGVSAHLFLTPPVCPGEGFDAIFRGRGRAKNEPIWDLVGLKEGEESFHEYVHEFLRTAEKVRDWDAQDHVLVAAAHDEALLGHEDSFARGKMNGFVSEHEWARWLRWLFLRDFAWAVGDVG
ncbi:hypothetical protein C8A03DRAFT_35272 [Achaetomium macrosporum]|uniref:Uncharacterized protein n=1 Tax=Achaetomium macrosporum TaxID=79813 RepID=A0AAN7HCZ3_9PEZI|nr:hypothetical protein C8A03DRAFT_35272 [Achaetomium macrosporum]